MNSKTLWAKVLVIAGAIAAAVGTLDPLEGSILILAGGGLVALGTWLGEYSRPMRLYWAWVFGLLLSGVAALWGLSWMGGVGGETGRSPWWLLVCAPYVVGWLLGFGGIILRIVRSVGSRRSGGGQEHGLPA